MRINQALDFGVRLLKNKQTTSAILDAEVLLSFVLKKEKEFIYTYPENAISQKQFGKFRTLIKKRVKGEPVAYLVGRKEFFGLNFLVNKNVLIPRPDTEVLVATVIQEIKRIKNQEINIYDVGTGSGCVAIALKKFLPQINIVAYDISTKALRVAEKNAKINKVKVEFIKSNLLQKLKSRKIDIVTANLPYIDFQKNKKPRNQETKNLKFEPNSALDGGKDGLEIYEKLFQQITDLKYRPKFIFCEIDPGQKIKINKIIKSYLPKAKISFVKDLCDRVRVAAIEN